MPARPRVDEVVLSAPDRGTKPAERSTDGEAAAILRELGRLTTAERAALVRHRALVKRLPGSTRFRGPNGRELRKTDLLAVVDALLETPAAALPQRLAVEAEDADGYFTAYYSPEVEVSRVRTAKFRYPILGYPEGYVGRLPSRRAIEQDSSLRFDTLALAWASHPLDVYQLQLQGSGFVRYRDGAREYLAYGGTNRHPYQSLGLALTRLGEDVRDISPSGLRKWISRDLAARDTLTALNPNYGFFRRSSGKARGAAGVALTPHVSVAADPDVYPLGSILVARVPNPALPNRMETRLLLVQDTGGAIQGEGRFDLYTGIGAEGLHAAERVHAEGEVFRLQARRSPTATSAIATAF